MSRKRSSITPSQADAAFAAGAVVVEHRLTRTPVAWRVTRARRCTVGIVTRDFKVGDVLMVGHFDRRVIEQLKNELRLVEHVPVQASAPGNEATGLDVVAWRLENAVRFSDGKTPTALPAGHLLKRGLYTADEIRRVRAFGGRLVALTASEVAEPWEPDDAG